VAREIPDAPFGTLAVGDVARHEDVALELRVVAVDARAADGHRNRLPGTRAHERLARLVRRLLQIEVRALALFQHREHAAAEQLLLTEPKQLAGSGIRHLDDPVGGGDEHRIGHAVEHAVQVALVDRRLAQPPAHALERLLQLTEDVAPLYLDRARVITLADALGAADE